MATEEPPPPPPPLSQLHGVVIISLPPADNPSKGKTITAFTLSDSGTLHHPPPPPPPPPQEIPSRSPPSPERRRFLSSSARKALASVLGAFLLAFSLWLCLFSEAPLELLGSGSEEEGRDERSFLLPLYPKTRGRVLREVGGIELAATRYEDGTEGVRLAKQGSKMTVSSYSSSSPSSSTVNSNSTVALPIQGNAFPDGQYYTSIFVGNPPRPYFLDVDTGSDLTWIQCDAPCASCAKGPHPLYKPAKGKIVPPRDLLCQELQGNQNSCESCLQCDYEIEYADRSSSMGVLARDEMHLIATNGDREKLSFVFGCAYDQQGQLLASPAKTDGILGLSSAKISLPSQLANQGIISNVIGHCITSQPNGGGYMFLGDDFIPLWGMTWVPARSGLVNFYYTEVQKVNYGDVTLSAGGQKSNLIQVIFDSGSSYTFFPDEAYNNLIASFEKLPSGLARDGSDQTLPVCWKADFPVRSVKDVKRFFKPLTLQFKKRWWVMPTTFTIPPEGYLIISGEGNVCLGILNGMEVHHGSTIIIGDVSLRGKLVVYDNVQNKIGWARSNCAKPQKTGSFPFFF